MNIYKIALTAEEKNYLENHLEDFYYRIQKRDKNSSINQTDKDSREVAKLMISAIQNRLRNSITLQIII